MITQVGFTLFLASSGPQFPQSRPEGICRIKTSSLDRGWLVLSACSLLKVHYSISFLQVHGWPVGDETMVRLDLLFWKPPQLSVEISPGPDLHFESGKSLIEFRIRTRRLNRPPQGFLLWFPEQEN